MTDTFESAIEVEEALATVSGVQYARSRDDYLAFVEEDDSGDVAIARCAYLAMCNEVRFSTFLVEGPTPAQAIERLLGVAGLREYLAGHYQLPPSIDLATLRYHRHGTTSVILRARRTDSFADDRAIKLVVSPYTEVPEIIESTRSYSDLIGRVTTEWEQGAELAVARVLSSTENCVVMEYVPGRSLHEVLHDPEYNEHGEEYSKEVEQKFGDRLRLAMAVLSPMLRVLEACSRAGVVHGDLNPRNIIVDIAPDRTRTTVVDFGLNFVAMLGLGNSAQAVEVAGYMAPELQASLGEGGFSANSTADLWSVGAVLLDILCPPLDGSSVAERVKILYEVAPQIGRLYDDLTAPDAALRGAWLSSGDDYGAALPLGQIRLRLVGTLEQVLQHGAIDGNYAAPVESRVLRRLTRLRFADQLGRLLSWSRRENGSVDYTGSSARYLAWWGQLCVVALVVCIGTASLYFAADAFRTTLPWGTDLPFRDRYSSRSIWDNGCGRLVAVSFAIVAAQYYLNIFSGITTRDARTAFTHRLMEFSMRLNSFVFAIPILVAIIVEPRWWPYCSAIGCAFVAVNNFIVAIVSKSVIRTRWVSNPRGAKAPPRRALEFLPFGASDLANFASKRDFFQWGFLMSAYAAGLAAIGLLSSFDVLQDLGFYAITVVLVNILKLYMGNCTAFAPRVRGPVSRILSLERRLVLSGATLA